MKITNPSAGGGSSSSAVSLFEATAGASGADYTTVASAITDGMLSIQVIADTTEDADWDIPAGLYVKIEYGVTVDMGDYQMDLENTTSQGHFRIDGPGTLEFLSTNASNGCLFVNQDEYSYFHSDNLVVDNNSTAWNCALSGSSNTTMYVTNMHFSCANIPDGGIGDMGNGSSFVNTTLVGVSTSTYECANFKGRVDGLLLSGSFSTSSAAVVIWDNCVATNILVKGSAIVKIDRGNVSNLDYTNGSCTVQLFDHAKITNSYIATITVGTSGDNCMATNCRIVNSSSTVSGAEHTSFVNCIFDAGLTCGGNYTRVVGCKVPALTVAATSTGSIISGCHLDAAISDSGAGTVDSGNYVY